MSNLIDYLEKVKDMPFDQEPLNLLDKVCINEIGYLTYEKCLTASDLKETINLHDYAEGKDLNPDYTFMVTKERVDLAEAMVRSRRFTGLNLSDYCSVLDKDPALRSGAFTLAPVYLFTPFMIAILLST